jgi:5-methylcytosine-specific restriction endonuclease McrA
MGRGKEKWRNSGRFREAREEALREARGRCEQCLEKDTHLTVHHIIRASDAPSLRYLIANLKVLCKPCHKQVEIQYKRKLKLKHIAKHCPEKFIFYPGLYP